jgi:putative DNA primase/helicase
MSDFLFVLQANGFMVDSVEPDGKFHRCKTVEHPKKKNGYYKLNYDGRVGYYGDFSRSGETLTWKASAEQIELLPQRSPEEIQARKDEERRVKVAAVHAARDYYAMAKPMQGGHPYLESHGLTVQGCDAVRVDGKWMVVPMYRNGSLLCVQRIAGDGTKLYWEDAISKGTSLLLARHDSTLTVYCEGFATGLAIFQAIPSCTVVVCFTAANMLLVATESKPHGMTVVCADNDVATAEKFRLTKGIATNPGLEYGKKAADALGAGLAYPVGIKGTDWCDALMEGWSKMKVRQAILKEAKPIFR